MATMVIRLPDITLYGPIPRIHSCATADYPPYGYGGESESIPIIWSDAPLKTKSVVLVMFDVDTQASLGFTYLHWLVSDLPTKGSIVVNASATKNFPPGSVEVSPYVGVCPPNSDTHIYRFLLFARQVPTTKFSLSGDFSADGVISQLENDPDTIAYAEASGQFPSFLNYSPN